MIKSVFQVGRDSLVGAEAWDAPRLDLVDQHLQFGRVALHIGQVR